MIELQSKVELYVPGTTHVNQAIDTSEYVTDVATQFCEWFGGATVSENDGCYIASTGELVIERTRVVQSYCTTEQLEKYSIAVVTLAENLCRELQQESVAVVINGSMVLVTIDD